MLSFEHNDNMKSSVSVSLALYAWSYRCDLLVIKTSLPIKQVLKYSLLRNMLQADAQVFKKPSHEASM